MCTVSFLPIQNGYILTSSRDEKTSRPDAIFPQKYMVHGQQLFFPKDKLAGGTWVTTSINNFTLCLLNGAFEKHISKPPYKMSRGIMLLDFFKFNDVEKFIAEFDFNGIENFTLVIVDSNIEIKLHELVWDGNTLHHSIKDANKPYIWSSSTLYDAMAKTNRVNWFNQFIDEHNFTKQSIINFHKNAGDGSLENSILMNRENRVKTVSITCIDNNDENYTMDYIDIEKEQSSTLRIFKVECV